MPLFEITSFGADCNFIDDVCVQDIFSTSLRIQQVDFWHFRLVWSVSKETEEGRVQVPVSSIILGRTMMMSAANVIGRAHALGGVDTVGTPMGSS